jgi:hypothetical protein
MALKRMQSDSKLESAQAESNKNVSWLKSPFTWPAYVLAIVIVRVLLFYFVPKYLVSKEAEWTITNVAHGLVRAPDSRVGRGSHAPLRRRALRCKAQ